MGLKSNSKINYGTILKIFNNDDNDSEILPRIATGTYLPEVFQYQMTSYS